MEVDHQSPPLSPSTPPPLPKTYKLTASSISYTKSSSSTASLSFFKPCTASPPTYILRDVSFTAYPSKILAIVGPSGAGKSTLLDVLAARTSPSGGSLLLNGSPVNRSSYRKISSYVPQHDASLPQLTVMETFMFSADLLLVPDRLAAVTLLLSELNLAHVAGTRLSDGLSGGERRRVSIGLSLLHDPAVLLLDEPTSGLDSTSAYNVIQILCSIAASRHSTIILSIHQPSFKILSAIDQLLLLSRGSVVHHGSLRSLHAFLLQHEFTVPPQLNALEYAMEILTQLTPATPTQTIEMNAAEKSVLEPCSHASSRTHEIIILYYRFWKIIYRTRQLLLTNTLEALIVGLVLGTIYINLGLNKEGIDKRFGLFAFTLTFLLSSTTETLPIFINERPIIIREASGGLYRLSSYLAANTLVFLPYLLAVAVIYSAAVHFLAGLCFTIPSFSYFVLIIWVIVLMANSFVLFLSSLAPNYIAGTSLVTILLGGFFLFSGYFISSDSMPRYWLFMHFLSMYKYALDALLVNEYSCLVSTCLMWYEEGKVCMTTGRDVLEGRGLRESHRWTNVYVLVGFFVFYRVLCLIVLIRRVSRSRK